MADESVIHRPLFQHERVELMRSLIQVVRKTGEHVLSLKPESIHDMVEVDKHQFSTVDAAASIVMRAAIDEHVRVSMGTVLEESEISLGSFDAGRVCYPLWIGDAVEGSTNTKRGLAARVRRPIFAGSSVMVLEGDVLGTIAACAFYDFLSRRVFSAVRAEPQTFLAFQDEQLIPREDVVHVRGDSQTFATVVGYSHSNVGERAAVEQALVSAGLRITGGTRSSAQDLLELLGNQSDAYVDLRALFSGSEESRDAVLHAWDVGGLLPVLDGLGFTIMDVRGRSWQACRFDEPLASIAARPELGERIRRLVEGLPFIGQGAAEQTVSVPLPPARIGS